MIIRLLILFKIIFLGCAIEQPYESNSFTNEENINFDLPNLGSDQTFDIMTWNIENFPNDRVYKNYFAKGHYFKYSGKSPFSNLIYPVSGQHSLGIHVGFDLAGGLRFGPDVEFVDEIDYSFDDSLKAKFINSISD